MFGKIEDKKRSIGSAAKEIGIQEHVIRFWETQFPNHIQPTVGVGGRRYYYNKDIQILLTIKEYLYDKNYTIKGLQGLLDSGGLNVLESQEHKIDDIQNNTKKYNLFDENKNNMQRINELNNNLQNNSNNLQNKNIFQNKQIIKPNIENDSNKFSTSFYFNTNQYNVNKPNIIVEKEPIIKNEEIDINNKLYNSSLVNNGQIKNNNYIQPISLIKNSNYLEIKQQNNQNSIEIQDERIQNIKNEREINNTEIETKIVKEYVYLNNELNKNIKDELLIFQKKLLDFAIKLENIS